MIGCFFSSLVFTILLSLPTSALFTIDSTNSSILYHPATVVEPPGTTGNIDGGWASYGSVNDSQNPTRTIGSCVTSDNCWMSFPFAGSGLTIYYFPSSLTFSANLTIDSGAPFTFNQNSLDKTKCLGDDSSACPVYEAAGLEYGLHHLNITLLSVNATISSQSFFNFYHAVVDDVDNRQSNSSSASPSTPPSGAPSPSNKHIQLGPIIGGVVGGVTAVTLLLAIFFIIRRRGQHAAHDLIYETGAAIPYSTRSEKSGGDGFAIWTAQKASNGPPSISASDASTSHGLTQDQLAPIVASVMEQLMRDAEMREMDASPPAYDPQAASAPVEKGGR